MTVSHLRPPKNRALNVVLVEDLNDDEVLALIAVLGHLRGVAGVTEVQLTADQSREAFRERRRLHGMLREGLAEAMQIARERRSREANEGRARDDEESP